MKDFVLNESGDILIESNDIALKYDQQQEIQKIKQVLGTNLGEWEYDPNEGIDFNALFQKNPDSSWILESIKNGLHEIDEGYVLQECSYNSKNHELKIKVSTQNQHPMEIYLMTKEV